MKTLKYSVVWAFLFVMLSFTVNGVLTDNLVSYYKLDNNILTDLVSGNTLTNSATTNATGKIESARNLSANTNYLSSSSSAFNFADEVSFSFWVKTSSTADNAQILSKGNTGDYQYAVYITTTGQIRVSLYQSAGSDHLVYTSTRTISNNTFNYITVVAKNNNYIKVYINGVYDGQKTSYTGIWDTSGAAAFRIGQRVDSTVGFIGVIDELGIWNRALNTTEITQLYNNGIGLTYPFSTPVLTFSNISLVNNTYFNTSTININTTILNTSTNANVNQTYYLYYNSNNTFIRSSQYATNNLNGTATISNLTDNTYKIYFYAKNNQTNIFSANYTFTINAINITSNINLTKWYNATSQTFTFTNLRDNINFSSSVNGSIYTSLCTNTKICTQPITFNQGNNTLTIKGNNTATIEYYNFSVLIDSVKPLLSVALPIEYNYYNISGFNSSCTDVNLLSCNISINSQNKFLNISSFNFTTNGNQSYTITAVDLAGNTATTTGVTLVNPYIFLTFKNNVTTATISNYTFNGDIITGTIWNSTIYDLGLGIQTLTFLKAGYLETNISFTLNTTSNINSSYNIQPVTLFMRAYDGETYAPLLFDVTIADTTIVTFTNLTNLSKMYDELPTGDLTFTVTSVGYSQAIFYNTLEPYTSLNFNVYLTPINDTSVITFTVKDFDTNLVLSGVTIEARQIINDTRVTVQQSITGDNGVTYMYLNQLNDYEFVFTKDGYVLATVNSVPTVTTYIVKLKSDTSSYTFIDNVNYRLLPMNSLILTPANVTFSAFLSGTSISYLSFTLVSNSGTILDFQPSTEPTGTTFVKTLTFLNTTNISSVTMTLNYVVNGISKNASQTYKIQTLRSDEIDAFLNIGQDTTEEIQLFKLFAMLTIFAAVIITATRSESGRDYVTGILIVPTVIFIWAGWLNPLYGSLLVLVLIVLFMGANKR